MHLLRAWWLKKAAAQFSPSGTPSHLDGVCLVLDPGRHCVLKTGSLPRRKASGAVVGNGVAADQEVGCKQRMCSQSDDMI